MKFLRPEYFFRPSQIARRIAYSAGLKKKNTSAITPWGLTISFDPTELHGRAMLTLGLSDVRTNEVISRIIRAGDIAIDIGANIGIMTSLMVVRSGPTGSVYAFEPHPKTCERLKMNSENWARSKKPTADTLILPYAVSEKAGRAQLTEPRHFAANSGIATLEGPAVQDRLHNSIHDVETISFDEWSTHLGSIRLIKIDVEGHEDSVLEGMTHSLDAGRVDYIILEEMRPLPSPATVRLRMHGYRCFLIDRSFWRPRLVDVEESPQQLIGEATNILAVSRRNDISDLITIGWSCLK